jgi:hypothetical protein
MAGTLWCQWLAPIARRFALLAAALPVSRFREAMKNGFPSFTSCSGACVRLLRLARCAVRSRPAFLRCPAARQRLLMGGRMVRRPALSRRLPVRPLSRRAMREAGIPSMRPLPSPALVAGQFYSRNPPSCSRIRPAMRSAAARSARACPRSCSACPGAAIIARASSRFASPAIWRAARRCFSRSTLAFLRSRALIAYCARWASIQARMQKWRPDGARKRDTREHFCGGAAAPLPIAEAIGPHAPSGAAFLGHTGLAGAASRSAPGAPPGAFCGLAIRPLNTQFPISGSVQPGGCPAVYSFLSLQLFI